MFDETVIMALQASLMDFKTVLMSLAFFFSDRSTFVSYQAVTVN